MSPDALHITGDEHADRVLTDDPFALLVGMLLDQQIPLEKAFTSPWVLEQRLGHGLDEAASHAAEQIRFKPAKRDGQPSDYTALVHIVFQLA